jgi:hypothetical protein
LATDKTEKPQLLALFPIEQIYRDLLGARVVSAMYSKHENLQYHHSGGRSED